MSDRDLRSSHLQPNRLRFGRYVLDLDRACLFADGNEIALRPKTFGVLRHLVENRGRLVSKDELFATIWPNLAVTDDALVQSVGELRRALGDDGPRLIRTIPRRGYRFESDVADADATGPLSANVTLPNGSSIVQQPSELTARRPRTPTSFGRASAHLRVKSVVSVALVGLIAAGLLWRGVETRWKFLSVPERSDRTASKSLEIGAKPAIAFLPLVAQGDDRTREYFADGLTQDIINGLGRFSSLTVLSWNAVFPYKGRPAGPEEIARTLGVRYMVEGGVRQSGERVRVTAQLVDTRNGRVLWSHRFDEALAHLFSLQDAITSQIVGALAVRVTEFEQRRALAQPTENLDAYDYVLRARPALQRPTRTNNAEARILLRHAIELDPTYAAAYAALADSYQVATVMGWAQSPSAFLSRAEELARKALSLDESEVRAHVILGRIHIFHQRYSEAAAEIERAIAINPNDANALAGRGNILMWSGHTDAAVEVLEHAQHIDPDLNAIDRNALALAYYLKQRYQEAAEEAELNLRKTEDARFSYVVLAAAYAQLNRSEDAERAVNTIRRVDPTFDPRTFGSKFLNTADLEQLRNGFRKAGLYAVKDGLPSGN
jgi:TolB-like protein/DNA-binding winged helix-turn-helix (wHTH) protein/cytochrome c-type biogenesis protein CcmH/NrfG